MQTDAASDTAQTINFEIIQGPFVRIRCVTEHFGRRRHRPMLRQKCIIH